MVCASTWLISQRHLGIVIVQTAHRGLIWVVFSHVIYLWEQRTLSFVFLLAFLWYFIGLWAVVILEKIKLCCLQRKEVNIAPFFGVNNSYYNEEGLFAGYHFFKFPTSPRRRNRWCNIIKRQHGRDGFTVTCSATVVCNEHLKQQDRKLSGRLDLKEGLWNIHATW